MVRSPSLLLPPSCFVPRMPDHPSRSAFRLFPRRVLHFSQDTSVRALSHFRLIHRPREHSNFTFSPLLQLQGALVSFSWIHVLVWDHDDHLYTLHYLYCPQLRAGVPRYPQHNSNGRTLFRQGLVAIQDIRCRHHDQCYHQIRCTFSLSFI
jgi:hypothetical protein